MLLLAGCAPAAPPEPTPAPLDLLGPGAAINAVNQLTGLAHTKHAIKVTIDEFTATMTYVVGERAITLSWNNGQVAAADSDVHYVGQTGFDLSDFNLNNVGLMFAQAATLADSSTHQQLQINEYNAGRVMMTVTTSPESQTIFFRPDATLINWLVFATASGVREALQDVAGDGVEVVVLGLNDQGFYADVRDTQSVIERRTRPAKLPSYTALRTASSDYQAFSPRIINPAVVAHLLSTVPAAIGKADSRASLVIDRRDGLSQPLIRLSVGLTTRVFTLDGTDVTDELK